MYSPILTQCLHRLVNTCPLPGSVYNVIARPSSLTAGVGVIATLLSISAAPSIDSATIRIVLLILVLPGLSFSRCETSRRRTVSARACQDDACAMHEIGVLPPRHRQTKEVPLRHDETIVTNARILTLKGVED